MAQGRHLRWQDWGVGKKALAIAGGIVAGAGLALLFGFVVMWLWNGLMPRIFKLPTIGYWEGWGLVVLSSILFKASPRGGGGGQDRKRKRIIRERMEESAERAGGLDPDEAEEAGH
jgi:hypothetical protein